MTGYSVDGISTANVTANGSLQNAYPSSEGLAELKVTAFNNSAEFSQVADITFITKSGTNQFHGSLFEYLQNDVLDATILNFTSKAPKRFNTFGGSLGGPVTIPHLYSGKDKTFFFVDYEGNRRRTAVAGAISGADAGRAEWQSNRPSHHQSPNRSTHQCSDRSLQRLAVSRITRFRIRC